MAGYGTPQEAWASQALLRMMQGGRDPVDAGRVGGEFGDVPLMQALYTSDFNDFQGRQQSEAEDFSWAKLAADMRVKKEENRLRSQQLLNARFQPEQTPQQHAWDMEKAQLAQEMSGKQKVAEMQAVSRLEQERIRQAGQAETKRIEREDMKIDPNVLSLAKAWAKEIEPKDVYRQSTLTSEIYNAFRKGKIHQPPVKPQKPPFFDPPFWDTVGRGANLALGGLGSLASNWWDGVTGGTPPSDQNDTGYY